MFKLKENVTLIESDSEFKQISFDGKQINLDGSILIHTDKFTVNTANLKPNLVQAGKYLYQTQNGNITVEMYTKDGNAAYRNITCNFNEPITLLKIEFVLNFQEDITEFIDYKSFINAPASCFIRFDSQGLFTGIENPFFKVIKNKNRIELSYEPSLLLEANEVYTSEAQFIGGYTLSGEEIKEIDPVTYSTLETGKKRARFFNPSGMYGIDKAEIAAMRHYVSEYYEIAQKQFKNILYYFFYPQKQLPKTQEETAHYLDMVDRFKRLSGDIIAFNPHLLTTIPTLEKPYWELAPKDTPAQQILEYAQNKGIQCGYYMGVAFNGDGGNAALLPYRPEMRAWKKKDSENNLAEENCLACDEYLDWWFEVQKNTIEKYNLGYWSWDPGPGNGNHCFAENHGHIPGKGEYKGWRNSLKLLKRLKDRFPQLYLMSFYGRKEYGIWGFKYFDQHEVYWEQTVLYGATLHSDLHDDRVNAHGVRLQNSWCMNFRFVPPRLGHGLVTRMGESCYDNELDKIWDLGGWKYALLSGIACCGSVTLCSMPEKIENVPEMEAFYRKWIQWAKTNISYCDYAVTLSDTVENGVVDGFARIHNSQGQIFLFNSSPNTIRKKIMLDDKIGFTENGKFALKFLYPESIEGSLYQKEYQQNDVLDIVIPAYGAIVLEVCREIGIWTEAIPYSKHSVNRFSKMNGEVFLSGKHDAYEEISLKTKIYFKGELEQALEQKRPENECDIQKKIDCWNTQRLPFNFSWALQNKLVLYLPFDGVHQPESIVLCINGKNVPVETFCLHDKPLSRFAYINDYVEWDSENEINVTFQKLAQNSFLGLYLEYPDSKVMLDLDEVVQEEKQMKSNKYFNPTLVIDSMIVSPDPIYSKGAEFTVTVKTSVPKEEIENVIYIHPTLPVMSDLTYDPVKNEWSGVFQSIDRSKSIFDNTVTYVWICAKDGGVGPKASYRHKISFYTSEHLTTQN